MYSPSLSLDYATFSTYEESLNITGMLNYLRAESGLKNIYYCDEASNK